ncbi:hypothetical protein AB0D37_03755 [Streptomyces sp. NPDC048384]|uniref:hypothetical protein n=1 Tax=Streptomyces sp. NPDC048384 TaxID=3155487 RepID=UPI0034230975
MEAVPRLLAHAVAHALGERLRALLQGLKARRATGLHGGADVVALLGAEADVHRLADEVGDDRLDRRDRRLFHGLDECLEQRLFELVEDTAHEEAGRLGGAHSRYRGQTEGERRGGGRGGDLDGQGDQLGDHRPLGELDEVGAGLHHVRDEEGGLGGVTEVAVAAPAVELLVRLRELVDRLAGVVGGHRAGAGVGLGVQVGDVLTELAPQVGRVSELVLVRRRPVVAQHLENPLEFVRQHHRHSSKHPRQTTQPYNSLTREGKSHRSTAVRKVYGLTGRQLQGVAVTSPFQVAAVAGSERQGGRPFTVYGPGCAVGVP